MRNITQSDLIFPLCKFFIVLSEEMVNQTKQKVVSMSKRKLADEHVFRMM